MITRQVADEAAEGKGSTVQSRRGSSKGRLSSLPITGTTAFHRSQKLRGGPDQPRSSGGR